MIYHGCLTPARPFRRNWCHTISTPEVTKSTPFTLSTSLAPSAWIPQPSPTLWTHLATTPITPYCFSSCAMAPPGPSSPNGGLVFSWTCREMFWSPVIKSLSTWHQNMCTCKTSRGNQILFWHFILHVWYSNVRPKVGTKNMESPKNPDGISAFVFSYMCTKYTCIYIYMLGSGMKSELTSFFLWTCFSKKKSKRCERNTVTSNPHGFVLHSPSIQGNRLLFKVKKAIIITEL